jgi:ribosome-associated protein
LAALRSGRAAEISRDLNPGYAAAMIPVTAKIAIDEREIEEQFVRASGPGGQNVNKLSTAVQLRFDVRHSPSLPPDVRARLERLAGARLTRDGILVIIAQRHRTQARNREDALERLVELIRQAAVAPVKRRPTRPTKASRERRIESKKRQSGIKRLRRSKPSFD